MTVNGKSAYIYYVSPSQVNALTPPNDIAGSVNVVVTNNGVSSAPIVAQAQALSPSFFVFDGVHVVATHLNYTDVGPTTLYPGLTTPAQPGETIVLFANGLGTDVHAGSPWSGDAVRSSVADAGDHHRRNPGQRPVRRIERDARRISVQRGRATQRSEWRPTADSDLQRGHHAGRCGAHRAALASWATSRLTASLRQRR